MSPDEASAFVMRFLGIDGANFYGRYEHLSVGRGLIYANVRHPSYNLDTGTFGTLEGFVYVMTHECDVSQENVRPFNDDVLICPLMPFDQFVAGYRAAYGEDKLKSYLANLGKLGISRLMFFPSISEYLNFGAVAFFNQICGTKLLEFGRGGVRRIGGLSEQGHVRVQKVLERHFLRQKVEALSATLH